MARIQSQNSCVEFSFQSELSYLHRATASNLWHRMSPGTHFWSLEALFFKRAMFSLVPVPAQIAQSLQVIAAALCCPLTAELGSISIWALRTARWPAFLYRQESVRAAREELQRMIRPWEGHRKWTWTGKRKWKGNEPGQEKQLLRTGKHCLSLVDVGLCTEPVMCACAIKKSLATHGTPGCAWQCF